MGIRGQNAGESPRRSRPGALRELPLAELRRRFVAEGERVSDRSLAELSQDPRRGARSLARSLEVRRARTAREGRRLQRLFALEHALRLEGRQRIAGIDEVGVGPLAGPVVAAAVVLPPRVRIPGLNDSKQLSSVARECLAAQIRALACDLSLGSASPHEISQLNIHQATRLAMQRAVEGLAVCPDMLLVDARTVPGFQGPQRALIHGDARVASIAAASIVAKVYRDAFMRELDGRYPGYGFAHNAGYATAEHLRALAKRGPTPIHRQSFAPVRAASLRGG